MTTALVGAWVVFASANGITRSSIALLAAALVLPAVLVATRAAAPRARSCAVVVAASLVLGDAAYLAPRIVGASGDPRGLRLCEGDVCGVAPLASRVVSEHETVRAGLLTAELAGFIGGDEASALARLLERAYIRHTRDARFRATPNVVLAGPGRSAPRYLLWTPSARRPAPCLIFLHGFGGPLSVYVEALVAGGLDDVVIAAPIGDVDGLFDTARGRGAVRALLSRHLPPGADRSRVFLVGLSNGARALSGLLADAEIRRRVRGAVFVSGASDPIARALDDLPALFVSGEDDPRFAIEGIVQTALAYQARGARVELEVVPGDHFVMLSRAETIARRVHAFVRLRSITPSAHEQRHDADDHAQREHEAEGDERPHRPVLDR